MSGDDDDELDTKKKSKEMLRFLAGVVDDAATRDVGWLLLLL